MDPNGEGVGVGIGKATAVFFARVVETAEPQLRKMGIRILSFIIEDVH